jgi:hypothetical protein
MPISPPPPIPGQITPNGIAPSTQQYNFGAAIGQVLSWNPNCSVPMIQSFINDAIRQVTGMRYWYGNLTRGQIITPAPYTTGTIALTFGSTSVQGVGTNWTQTLSGIPITQQSLRVGYYAPIYNIVALDQVHQVLTLDLPWGNPSVSSSGYFITQYYYSIPNLKFFFSMRNLQLYYRINTNYSQAFIDNYDPSRLILQFPRLAAAMPPDPSGNYQFELWPASNVQTSYPWTGYIQPPTLSDDTANFPAFMRVDAVISYAISQALLWRPKDNPNYSEATALEMSKRKQQEFDMRISTAAAEDEGLWRQDIVMREEMQLPLIDPATGILTVGGDTLRAMTAYGGDYY